jgi:hypothetical protein
MDGTLKFKGDGCLTAKQTGAVEVFYMNRMSLFEEGRFENS